jgi:hypothetical protein
MTCTALYLMHNAWSVANYKVGISRSPSRRSGQVCNDYEVDPDVISTVWFTCTDTARKAENYWHRYLQDFRTDDHSGKEWFALTNEYVQKFCKWSELSKSRTDIAKWLFNIGASRKQLGDYDYELIRRIPRHTIPPSIDVWTRKGFNDSYN